MVQQLIGLSLVNLLNIMLSFHLRQILCFELRCLGETAIELGRILDHGLRYQSICSSNLFIFYFHIFTSACRCTNNCQYFAAQRNNDLRRKLMSVAT
ncbi:hypothetical protein HanRHA438_Chr09g0429461 [Helianthus annuus]|nr:hypothetical protein HanHA300_Chr04g0144241 [Helianthus annuus]KAJ0758326.1 hypothetical protein HanLR1_Chr04g0149101 [Helianthus annuus]KAJ0761986.1 hypothetical protein HanOQP8_Chr04g0156311 [Helianthus annuus]KAJ0890950.1 hypothetical protein HanRHA438_Chr09g0429461 [Helianthus annuus]